MVFRRVPGEADTVLDREQKLGARIRVLHVVLNLHEGGLERMLGDLLRGMDPLRFESHVLALHFLGRLSKGLEEHATLHVADSLPRWSMVWPSSLAAQIRRIAPDVVHTHSGVWYKASLAARMAKVPFLVHTDHGRQAPDRLTDRIVDGLASRRTDAIIAVSSALARQLADTVVRDPSRLRVIRNGIDTDRFRKGVDTGKVRSELDIHPDAPIIGSIGRLDAIKRFDLMILAFADMLTQWRGASSPVLVIAGDGPERSTMESLIAKHRLREHVRLLGWRDDVQELHAAFTLFTMSSRSEGTSIGLLEAMSAEVCPVVTDVGGNADVLGQELRHRLCAPENPTRLWQAWAAALTDPVQLRLDGALARRRVEESFSLSAMIREHERLYTAGRKPTRTVHEAGNWRYDHSTAPRTSADAR